MSAIDPDDISTWPADWLPYIPMPEVKGLSSLSRDTIMREYKHLVVHLSPRRVAMRRGHAIMLGTRLKAPSAKENSAV
jgi:hypothetical protein